MIIEWFKTQPAVIQALIGTLFTWGLTALGAGMVFFFKEINRRVLDVMLGFAAGVMIAASYWSLLAPAIALSEDMGGVPSWVPAAVGFLLGAAFLRISDRLIPHLHLGMPKKDAEGPKTSWQRSILLVLAITIHNIPEGLAVGVAFGAVAVGYPGASLAAAVALALGIGIQNFPEGTAVSVPLRREGLSRWKCFLYGQASGIVEPIFGVLGALAVVLMRPILPYALAFAAGAMIFVVIEELIPESHEHGNIDLATMGVIVGFTVMMTLDVALG
ncbi:MAG: ZIP family metal transporter [Spirochaetaceae bacterium]|nr:ZIP family metal transporter [Spirochaetaceae bacterium]MDT8297010.1 ZIP family metal transporter [Spirochaetaceae bacterium]